MANQVCDVLLTKSPLDLAQAAGEGIVDYECGAFVEFQGVVRRTEAGGVIAGIDYEAHEPMALHQMQSIAEAAIERFDLAVVRLHHRIGFVRAGEASLSLKVASGHRGPAFEAATWIVWELKRRVPIWKLPRFKSVESSNRIESKTEALAGR